MEKINIIEYFRKAETNKTIMGIMIIDHTHSEAEEILHQKKISVKIYFNIEKQSINISDPSSSEQDVFAIMREGKLQISLDKIHFYINK